MGDKRIAVCASQVPFVSGGAEVLVESLARELSQRGFKAEVVRLPLKWYPRAEIIKSYLAWRLLDLTESNGLRIDLVICTKFPSYVVKHPNKVTWLTHQFRQVYDWFGTPLSDFRKSEEDQRVRELIVKIDNRTLRESRKLYTISRNTATRLKKYNDLDATPLYHPPKLSGKYRCHDYGDYVLSVGRLDRAKRVDLLVRAMSRISSKATCVVAGVGPELDSLTGLASKLRVEHRVKFLGFVPDDKLLDLYASCFSVFYAPFDEDFGYVTLEAFSSLKPVITTYDAGGVLEFVKDTESGCVASADPQAIAEKIDFLFSHKELCRQYGNLGANGIKDISWDAVIERLTETL